MKQMQIYVSMPSFNISESTDWHRTRAQLDAVCVCVSGCQRMHACSALDCMCVCLRVCFSGMLLFCDQKKRHKGSREREKKG